MARSKAASNNNITIEFKAKGEKQLIAAIQALSGSTTQLKNSQKQLGTSIALTEKAQKNQIASGALAMRNQRNMNKVIQDGNFSFSVFRSRLLLASFAVGLLGASIGRLVAFFGEQEASEKRIDAALASTGNIAGLTGKQIREMTANLENIGIVGDEVNNKVAALLLTFTNIRGEAFERTMIAANNMAISISGGIPTFEQLKSSALQLGKALQDPAGQLGALSRSGFTFTGTQKEMIKNLVEQGKLFEAQSIILDAADTQFGDLTERMRETSQGAFAALGNASGSLAETFGKILTPTTVAFTNSLTGLFASLAKNEAGIKATIDSVKLAVKGFIAYRAAVFAASVTTAQLTAAFLTFRAVVNPATAVLSFLGVTYFQIKKRQHELKLQTEETTKAIIGQVEAFEKEDDTFEKTKKSLEERVLATRNSMEIHEADIKIRKAVGTEAKLQAIQDKKAIMVKQELSKVDEKYREIMRASVVEIVEGIIAKERNKVLDEAQIENLKKINEAQAQRQVMIQGTASNMTNLGVIEAKIAALKDIDDEKAFKAEQRRIEQLEKADAALRALGIENDFLADAIKSGQTVAQLSFSHTDEEVQKALASVGLMIDAQGRLVDVTAKFKEISVSAFEQFQERASLAVTALSGFSQAQSQLVEQRMQREMEALKATKEFEDATQEEREIMENRVEQRFKSQRRRAFQISKATSIADATMNVAQAYTKALATMPPPGNIPLASFIAALGAAQVAAIAAQPAPRFAVGGSFTTSGPRNIVVGEQGAEQVTIRPLGGQARMEAGPSKIININVSAPLIDDTILDVIIPKIEEAAELNL